jgi:putative membrane protein
LLVRDVQAVDDEGFGGGARGRMTGMELASAGFGERTLQPVRGSVSLRVAAYVLLGVHVIALGLGLFGILVAIPHPEYWAGQPSAMEFFAWALSRGGSFGMISGAAAMVAWGAWAIGWRRTLLFAVIAIVVSATAELTGTKTGWPFGGYEYLTFLGPKIAGRVPYGIPFSWFYMGFAAFALAGAIVPARGRFPWRSILLGSWLLCGWDLVLDPSMVALPQIQFWRWFEHGPYFGMPLRNIAGWYGTGVAFMALARLAWRDDADMRRVDLTLPFAIYTINIVWSMILATSAGLWPTAVLAVIFSLAPAALALRPRAAA